VRGGTDERAEKEREGRIEGDREQRERKHENRRKGNRIGTGKH
jgi:hypothetical protein